MSGLLEEFVEMRDVNKVFSERSRRVPKFRSVVLYQLHLIHGFA